MKRIFFLLLTIFCFAGVAQASSQACYTVDEAEAEQGIRIHSELMVIGLNCQHMAKAAGDQNLYMAYREFTAEHVKLFATYEKKLMDYYKRTGAKSPEASLDTLRTELANKISNDAARMRPDMFCMRYAPRITKVASMDNDMLRRWASTFYPEHPVSKPICE
jgi:hypothetical protein